MIGTSGNTLFSSAANLFVVSKLTVNEPIPMTSGANSLTRSTTFATLSCSAAPSIAETVWLACSNTDAMYNRPNGAEL